MCEGRFSVKVSLRHRLVLSTWVFNMFVDGFGREVNEKVGERGALIRICARYELNQLLFADDIVLVVDLGEKLHNVCWCLGSGMRKEKKMRMNVKKSSYIM